MEVTKIEPINTQKSKIFLDEEFAFVLYKGEISRNKIKEGFDLSEEVYLRIKGEIVTKRAKKRVLHLLEQVPRSENQIRTKLKQNYYTPDVIEVAVDYAKGFGYIDDTRYASMYIQSKVHQKSRREIYAGLMTKGVSRDIANEALEAIYDVETEEEAIHKLIRKKGYDLENITRDELRKLNGFLMRKGFSYDQIQEILSRVLMDME